jgi:dethiobiotin synthetase
MVNSKGIFVTGTDTGVGKTIVAATIARLLTERGISVGVLKPVTSGCIELGGQLVSEDAELLKWASGTTANEQDCSPYLLREPIAPSVAASQEGVRIDFAVIKAAFDRLAASHDFVIVEGAGGLMVPLAGGLLTADLITYLGLPIVVVARPGLGTVNHTLLTTFVARQMGITVSGIIINGYPHQPGKAEEYAPHMLDSLSGSPLLGIFPFSDETEPRAIVEQLAVDLKLDPTTKILLREIGCPALS